MFISTKDKGTALLISLILMVVLLGTSAAFVLISASRNSATVASEQQERCFAIMQAAVAESVMELNRIEEPDEGDGDGFINATEDQELEIALQGAEKEARDGETVNNPNAIGPNSNWIAFGGGFYKVVATKLDPGTGRFRLFVHTVLNNTRRVAEVIVQANIEDKPSTVFRFPVFQGKRRLLGDFDPDVTLELSGNRRGGKDRIRSFPPPADSTLRTYDSFTDRRAIGDEPAANGVFPGNVPGNVYAGGILDVNGEAEVSKNAFLQAGEEVKTQDSNLDPIGDADGDGNDDDNDNDQTDEDNIRLIPNSTINNPERFDYESNISTGLVIPVEIGNFTSNRTTNFSDGGRTTADFNDPRHIFQANPTRRHLDDIAGTARNDFFLSDPYARFNDGRLSYRGSGGADRESSYDGPGFEVTISPDSNDKVFLVRGNMWIHHKETFTFRINTTDASGDGQDGTRVTFVANNIFISDNVTYQDLEKDAIAMIAIKEERDFPDEFNTDPRLITPEGSGQIRFGDPDFGTTFRFTGFMFAEHDFFTDNVSNDLFVYGTMTAGNRIRISRNIGRRRNSLTIDFDARIDISLADPENPNGVNLPGLPTFKNNAPDIQQFEAGTFKVRGLAEISANVNEDTQQSNEAVGEDAEGNPIFVDFSDVPVQEG